MKCVLCQLFVVGCFGVCNPLSVKRFHGEPVAPVRRCDDETGNEVVR